MLARDRKGLPLEAAKFRVSQSVVKEVAESGTTRLIDDAASSDAYQARMSIINLSLRTILCVALKTARGILGVIYVDSNLITRRFSERDVPLVEAFAAQAAVSLERVRLEQAEIERDRMRRQLETAAEIQRMFLPGTFPETPGLVGAVATVPALQVGGDLYDIIRFPDGRTGLVVGDVSGKGVPAALFGARLLSDVRYEALYHDDVGATLASVNEIVARRSTRGMFVTLLYAVYEPTTRRLTFANAGHLAPFVRARDGSVSRWEEALGVPLGIAPRAVVHDGGPHARARGDARAADGRVLRRARALGRAVRRRAGDGRPGACAREPDRARGGAHRGDRHVHGQRPPGRRSDLPRGFGRLTGARRAAPTSGAPRRVEAAVGR